MVMSFLGVKISPFKLKGPGWRVQFAEGADQLIAQSPADVHGLELVEACQDTGASHASQDVGSGSLHHGHEALVLQDLDAAVDGSLVLDTATRGHHHAPPDGVWQGKWSVRVSTRRLEGLTDGIGHQASGDGHSPAEQEGERDVGSVSQQERLQGVKQTEVHATEWELESGWCRSFQLTGR